MSNTKVDALCKLAGECLQMDQLKMAKELYEKVLAEDVDNIEAHLGLATVAYQASDFAETVSPWSVLICQRSPASSNEAPVIRVENWMSRRRSSFSSTKLK